MQTNKEIITEIIEDLENTVGLNWLKAKNAKINKDKLIECWSEYRKEPDYNFYTYAQYEGMCRAYKQIFKNIVKKNNQPWKLYILNIYKYNYCSTFNFLLKTIND